MSTEESNKVVRVTDAAKMIGTLMGVIDTMRGQILQMQGQFDDEDGAIADAIKTGDDAIQDANRFWDWASKIPVVGVHEHREGMTTYLFLADQNVHGNADFSQEEFERILGDMYEPDLDESIELFDDVTMPYTNRLIDNQGEDWTQWALSADAHEFSVAVEEGRLDSDITLEWLGKNRPDLDLRDVHHRTIKIQVSGFTETDVEDAIDYVTNQIREGYVEGEEAGPYGCFSYMTRTD